MAITSYKAVVGYYNGAGTPNITTAVTGQLSDGWIPIGAPILTDAYGQCTQMMTKTDATPVIATSAYTVVTAANPQPPDATWDAQGEPLWIDTTTYLQAYTKGGSYLREVVPVSRGGTGATTAAGARANLELGSLATLSTAPIANGGTGATTVAGARTNLELGSLATLSTAPIANGGTGATNASDARANLGLGAVATLNTVPVANGGTGATTVAAARTNLGLGTSQAVSFGSMTLSNVVTGAYAAGYACVVAGGSFGAQYSNPTAIAVDSTAVEGYITLMRVTVPGVGNPAGMDCFMYANGASFLRLNTGGANYVFNSTGVATATQWSSTSDERIKEDIARIDNPLEKMKRIKGVSWRLKTNGSIGHGFIAQDVEQDFPSAVNPLQDMQLSDGSVVKNVKSVDTYGVAAALHHEAILALMAKIEALEAELSALKSGK